MVSDSTKYHQEVSLLCHNLDTLNKQLDDIRVEFNTKILRDKLVEKWKNRLFELNVRYGIHTLLSNIDCLQKEKNLITEVIQSIVDNNCVSVESAKISMDAVSTSEKKYDFKWNVGAFEQDALKSRLKEISKEISKYDEMKDKLNIENSFSLDLTKEEKDILNI